MTTIEGGMVVTQNAEDDDLLRCLRSHGWSRDQRERQAIEAQNPMIDPRFLFINLGYNLRPMEIQAAFGLEQIGRLESMNANRRSNVASLRAAFQAHPSWRSQLEFPIAAHDLDPCWFGFPFLLSEGSEVDRAGFTASLLAAGIDTRPIVSGNMSLQPAVRLFDIDTSEGPYVGAQAIHDRGLFVGAHSKPLEAARIMSLVDRVMTALQV
jgi:CDP-6-deoxy-D-xylo-4-hexulose-3-dehydrase